MNTTKSLFCTILLFVNFISYSQSEQYPRFGIITDIQYCDCETAGSRFYRGVPDKLRAAVDSLDSENIEFILNFGDVINKYWKSFDTILPILNDASFDVYYTLGNHDFEELTQGQVDSLTILLNMPSRYYTFKKGDWRFVMLDANEISTYAYPEGSNEYNFFVNYILNLDEVNAHNWNGGVFSNQLSWLKNILAKADTLGEFVIVAGHPNIYPLNMNSMLNYEEVANILEAHNSVKMYMAGHWHDGAYVLNNGLHYLTFRAMLDYPDSTAFSIVDVTDNEIIINGFGREPDRILPYNAEYTLTVENGTGSGTYRQGARVELSPVPPSTDMIFSHWTGDEGVLKSITDSSAVFPMPAFNIKLTANFNAVTVNKSTLESLKVYPNPFTDHLYIKHSCRINKMIIFDISGRKKNLYYPGSDDVTIELGSLQPGMYFLKLVDERGNVFNKVISNH